MDEKKQEVKLRKKKTPCYLQNRELSWLKLRHTNALTRLFCYLATAVVNPCARQST